MGKAKFGDLYADFVAKHPQKAGRTLDDLHKRRAELAEGGTPRSRFDTLESLDKQIANYVGGFRLARACLRGCGETLTDPVSVWRGYGRVCWGRLTEGQRQAAEATAEDLFGPCPTAARAATPGAQPPLDDSGAF